MNIKIAENRLDYEKADYEPAIDWTKSLKDGAYAYQDSASGHETLYFGARYMEKTVDEAVFVDNDFMADMTVINPGKVGNEYIKTVGHYHQNKPGTSLAYPEVYEAVSGKFEYLLQSELDKDGKVQVIWVVAEPGDKVVMPPNFGHVSMNVGLETAIEVDIQKRDNPNGSDYTMFKDRCGGAFYRTEDGLKKNPNYEVLSLRIVKPLERPDLGLTRDKSLYDSFVEAPEKFDYLLNPENYDFSLDRLFVDIEL